MGRQNIMQGKALTMGGVSNHS